MFRKSVSGVMFILLLTGMFTLAFSVQPAEAIGTIYIRADGSVDPIDAPIQRNGDIYTLTSSISARADADGIVVERDNVVLDGAGHVVQGTGVPGASRALAGVLLRGNYVTIEYVEIRAFDVGVDSLSSSYNNISENTILNNTWGIWPASYSVITRNQLVANAHHGIDLLNAASYNIISDNYVAGNDQIGIFLENLSECNQIFRNNIKENTAGGISIAFSNNNSLYENAVEANGIALYHSSNNKIYHNNFTGNPTQASVDSPDCINAWDDGYPSGGNRWSDYAGVDFYHGRYQNETGKDGIGDTWYVISVNNCDNYPLMPENSTPSNSVSPNYYETSEYMIGKVAVGVIFPESNGTVDPDTENWNNIEESMVISKVETALNRLESFDPAACLSFQMDVHYRVPTSYEPISRTYDEYPLWMKDTVNYLGYSSVLDYVNDIRIRLQPDWAIVIFIVDSQNTSNGVFKDSWCDAGAALGGPWVITTTRYLNLNEGPLTMDKVIVHEICHTFYAIDEYDGCTEWSGYCSGYLNFTSVHNDDCIMGLGAIEGFVCNATREQLGWRDSNSNGIPDIIDTFPDVKLNMLIANDTSEGTVACTGYIAEVPYPNHNPRPRPGTRTSCTVNKIVNVEYRVDEGAWMNATPIDGSFDEAQENFTFTIPWLANSHHVIEVCATNSVGNNASAFTKPFFGTHDIGVTNLHASKTIVGQGHSMDVTAKILNYGPEKESFNITFYANSTTVQTQTVELTAQNLTALTIVWNSTSVPCGNYTLTACAGPLLGETDASDNNCTCDVAVHVGVPGDVSGPTQGVYDGKCDMRDISYLIIRFNSKPNSANWNPNADINDDGTVNMRDISIAIFNFNKQE